MGFCLLTKVVVCMCVRVHVSVCVRGEGGGVRSVGAGCECDGPL